MSDIPNLDDLHNERSPLAYENDHFLNGPDGRALRLEPTGGSPNVLLGLPANSIAGGVVGSIIGGVFLAMGIRPR